MFLKKERPSEEESNQKRIELDNSLKHAAEIRASIMNQKTRKLKEHSAKVSEMRAKSKNKKNEGSDGDTAKNFYLQKQFLDEISQTEDVEKFQIYMMQKETVDKATDFVVFIEKYCSTKSLKAIKYRPKIFMSIALLAHYPDEVMPNADAEETCVILKAKGFYDSITQFLSEFSKYTTEKHTAISWEWLSTIHMFDEWMVKDKTILFEKMKADFLLWTKTVGSLSMDDPSRYEWELNAVKYQNEILARICSVFGPGHIKLLSKEVEIINENFNGSKFKIFYDSESGKYSCEWTFNCKETEKGESLKAAQIDQKDLGIFEKLKSTNIQILHELMLKENNVDFDSIIKISGKSMEEISESNRETLKHLITILGSESDGKSISSALQSLFAFICSSLYELAGDNNDYCDEIKLVDCTIDSNDWVADTCALMKWALSMCKRCCAPARDQACNKLELCVKSLESTVVPSELTNMFTDIFAMFLDLLNLMRGDFCNFRLKSLVAQIEGKGIAEKYEFEELKKRFYSSYEKTRKWLQSSIRKDAKPLEILADSYLKMFDPCQDGVSESETPETFYLDITRLERYRNELYVFLKKEAALIYIKNHLKSENSSNLEEIMSKLLRNLESVINHEETRRILEEATEDISDNVLLKGNLARLFDQYREDKVFILLKQREMFKIRTVLINETSVQSDTLIGKMSALFRYNKACFSSIYDEIIARK